MITRHTVTLLLLGAALVVPALLVGPAAGAAEAPSPETESASETTSDKTPEDPKTKSNRPLSGSEARRANDKGGVFLPSEDISEDIAVSFPVDI